MNYYQFHIGDFRSGTANMSRLSRWIYRDMLDHYYDKEKPLTLDLDALCDAVGVESADERAIVERLLRFKFVKGEDGYRHEICERVIAEYHAKAEVARANGKLGGRPKGKTDGKEKKPSGFQEGSDQGADQDGQQDATGGQDASGSKTNHKPRTNNHKPESKPQTKDLAPPGGDAMLFPGVDPQVVADFKALRKQKKAAITETAIDGIVKQARIAGLTLEGALRICCARGWAGFNAEWIARDRTAGAHVGAGQQSEADYVANVQAALDRMNGVSPGFAPNDPNTIDMEQ